MVDVQEAWAGKDVINAYLTLIVRRFNQCNDGQAAVIDSYAMTAIWKHKFGRIRFAEKILLGEAIEFETSQKALHELRLDIATSLLRESDDLSRLCCYCGMEEQDEEHWICCDICQRWYHHQCVQRPPVDQQYLCPGCT
ncbi:hypothetical protein NQZ68_008439 [Dissostichus eleginoides]|nr:hypothetical protein NQZ68_008439 [Dissostichus eleginoides]